MHKRVAVILSGCGVYDGAEIHESVITLLRLDQRGAQVQCFAPNIAQMHVIDHLTGAEMPESRNVLTEAARIAREEWDAEARESAEKSVKTQLLLDAIADAQETEVSQDELTQQIIFQAQRYGMAPQEFIQQLQSAGQVGAVYADVRRNKALADVVAQFSVTDTDGNTVDTAEFFGSSEADDADDSDESSEK